MAQAKKKAEAEVNKITGNAAEWSSGPCDCFDDCGGGAASHHDLQRPCPFLCHDSYTNTVSALGSRLLRLVMWSWRAHTQR
eukprot:COSAG06_NODE_22652_length_717_cov_0.574434_1_plen_81_part_00